MGKLFTSAALGWFGRRILDWGGWLGTFVVSLIALSNSLPPSTQDSISRVLSGNWQDITLGAVIPFAIYVSSQVMSFRATTKPAVVTEDGKKVSLPELGAPTKTLVEEKVETAVERKKRRPNLLQILFGKRV